LVHSSPRVHQRAALSGMQSPLRGSLHDRDFCTGYALHTLPASCGYKRKQEGDFMGPFVPELISDQLNLVVALVLGLPSCCPGASRIFIVRRLAGVFYGYDFTVLRVFFTATVTAMSGVLLLGYFGLWIPKQFSSTDLAGSGNRWWNHHGDRFRSCGYCPGTSVCAAAIGKIDAMFFIGGGSLECSLLESSFHSTATSMIRHRSVQSKCSIRGNVSRLFAFLLIAWLWEHLL